MEADSFVHCAVSPATIISLQLNQKVCIYCFFSIMIQKSCIGLIDIIPICYQIIIDFQAIDSEQLLLIRGSSCCLISD